MLQSLPEEIGQLTNLQHLSVRLRDCLVIPLHLFPWPRKPCCFEAMLYLLLSIRVS